jgi:hypothetical protein
MAHLKLPIPWHSSPEQPCRPTYLKFENRSRALRPDASKCDVVAASSGVDVELGGGGGEGIAPPAGGAGLGGLPEKDGEVVGDSEADPKRSRRRWI